MDVVTVRAEEPTVLWFQLRINVSGSELIYLCRKYAESFGIGRKPELNRFYVGGKGLLYGWFIYNRLFPRLSVQIQIVGNGK